MSAAPDPHAPDPPARAAAVAALLRAMLADPDTAWSMGSFGAVAAFVRDPGEGVSALDAGLIGLATARGALVLAPAPGLRPVAYETALGGGWNHAVALCLPEDACAMSGRTAVTELGPDEGTARPEDRGALLFDLGLGLRAVDACVRTRDPEVIAGLRAGAGAPPFAPGNPVGPLLVRTSPHRVFVTRVGRVEVFTPIPAPGGKSPAGPHTHVLPALLRAGRTHAATTPIPEGFVPCGAIHPAHPYKDALGRPIPFDRARHDAFQRLLDAWGDPALVAVKRAAEAGLPETDLPDGRGGRFIRAARRAAVAQAAYLGPAGAEGPDAGRGRA